MAYDEGLAQIFRDDLVEVDGVAEKKMFGGLCFTLNGHMLCGVHQMKDEAKTVIGDGAMFRVGPDNYEQALSVDGIRELSFTGRRMKGLVECDAELLEDDARREHLVALAKGFAQSLPPK
ncbi:MAG: hypothetical protein EX271_02970 [Acidimicrobiales bacterium]|nr:hypothetical protein [Hyphomonadaceae bacterium]RZV43897.1 MAG: hypothetical protein EX271_02970 [Acidimicrobiales bacterium]